MVSVIITTYNRPKMLRQAIESVNAQSVPDIEVIVVDDNSSMDNSFCIPLVSKYIKNNVNKGLGESHKIGFRESIGEYVCFLDDDDYYTDYDFFKKAVSLFEGDKNTTIVCGCSTSKYEPSNKMLPNTLNLPAKISTFEYLQDFCMKYNKPQSTFTTVFRKSSLLSVGFNDMNKPSDTCLYLRALIAPGNVQTINTSVGHYRIHEVQMTKSQNPNFIIEVLYEKNEVYKIIKNKLESPTVWWKNQFHITFDYYMSSNPPKKDIKKVIRWSVMNCANSISMVHFLCKRYVEISLNHYCCLCKRG